MTKNKKIVLIPLLVVIIVSTIVMCRKVIQLKNNSADAKDVETTTNTLSYFNNLEAKYLRQILNEYIQKPDRDTTNGLTDTDVSYYESPFIVYEENKSLAGGKQLEIIFVNKPDKMFTAWVYKLATGEYQLKGFGQNARVSSDILEKIKTEYNQYFENSKYFY